MSPSEGVLSKKRVLVIAAITLIVTTSSAGASAESAAQLFARGDFAAAATAYQALLQRNPTDRDARLRLGAIRLYQNDLTAAEPLIDAVYYADPQNTRAQQLIFEVQRRRAEAARRTTLAADETTVPFVTADPLPVVRVVADGTSANFLIDTGADVVLEPAFAQRIGVKTTESGNGVFAGGLHAPTERGVLASLTLGDATAYDVPAHVMVTHAADLFKGLSIDGIVGTTYFERFLVTIDYPNNRLILRSRSPRVSARFQTEAASAGATIVPFYLVGDHFVMAQARVNDATPGLFLFDSGLAGGGLMPSTQLLAAAGITPNASTAQTGFGGGGPLTAIPFVAARIAVGTAVQRDVRGLYTPQGVPFGFFPFQVWGAISNDFLRHYAYTVDFDAMRIVLEAS